MKTLAPVEFRATTRAWIGELALPLVFMSLLALTAVRSGLDPLLAAVCLGASISFSLASTMAPMVRTVVLFDRSTARYWRPGRCSVGEGHFYAWGRVKAHFLFRFYTWMTAPSGMRFSYVSIRRRSGLRRSKACQITRIGPGRARLLSCVIQSLRAG